MTKVFNVDAAEQNAEPASLTSALAERQPPYIIEVEADCDECGGSGFDPGGVDPWGPEPCPACHGARKKRITRNFNGDMVKIRFVSMHYYILRKDGAYAGVTLWSGSQQHPARFAVADGKGPARHEVAKALYQGEPANWPPEPRAPR
jgi:hypothetical protein